MEKKLVEGLVAGSHKSYTKLYEKWVPNLFRFVFSLVKSEEVAQDIVQEVFVKIWSNRENINVDASFKSYLYTISYHMVIKEFRRQINNPLMGDYLEYCDNDELTNEGTAETQLDFDAFIIEFERAKTKLSPRQKEIFVLNKELNYSVVEIAKRLSISEQSARNQLSTSLKILRKELCKFPLLLLFYIS